MADGDEIARIRSGETIQVELPTGIKGLLIHQVAAPLQSCHQHIPSRCHILL